MDSGTSRFAMDEQGSPLSAVIAALRESIAGLLGVWLFGTWGTEHARPDSDIDLGVLAERPLTLDERLAAMNLISAVTDREVDLVDLTRNDAVIRAQAVAHGRRVYCAAPARCEAFEDFVYSDYARLNEERRAILRDISLRGRIYA
jgi:predicted nucleotidyltransferase